MRPPSADDEDYIEPWDAPALPGRAGSGLVGCLVISIVPILVVVGVSMWLIGGTIGWVITGVAVIVWLIFVAGAVWQIREMRQAGGYTRFKPPDS